MNVCVVVFGSFVTLKILISFSRSLFFKAEGIFCMWLEIKREREGQRHKHQFILTRAYFCILTTGTHKLMCQDDERVPTDIYNCTSKTGQKEKEVKYALV